MLALTGAIIEIDGREDAIREEVQREMRSTDAEWEFHVQLCRDLDKPPVEETRFSVWTGIIAHQPLGNVNRARKETYRHSADFRVRTNGCPYHEPASGER